MWIAIPLFTSQSQFTISQILSKQLSINSIFGAFLYNCTMNISDIVIGNWKVIEDLFVHISYIEHFVIRAKLVDLIELE